MSVADMENEPEWENRHAVEPTEPPDHEPFDRHEGPLDNEDDVRFLRDDDPRRKEIEEYGHGGFLHRLRERIHGRDDD
jgi:hypothetical protein